MSARLPARSTRYSRGSGINSLIQGYQQQGLTRVRHGTALIQVRADKKLLLVRGVVVFTTVAGINWLYGVAGTATMVAMRSMRLGHWQGVVRCGSG